MRLVGEPLFYIYLVYSLSFFTLAALVAKSTSRARSVPLIAAFDMLALFGLTHGVTELTDWFRFIRKNLGLPEASVLAALSQVTLIVSFVLLLQFAMNLLTAQSTSRIAPFLRMLPPVALTAFAIVVSSRGMGNILAIGLLGRYTFGFASASLAAVALVATAKALEPLGDRPLVRGLYVAATAFTMYAVFGGLIVTPILGVPVQLFRAACAVVIAFSCFSLITLSSTVAGAAGEVGVENF